MSTFTQHPTGTDTRMTDDGQVIIKATERALDSSGVISEARLTLKPQVARNMHFVIGTVLGIPNKPRKLEQCVRDRNELRADLATATEEINRLKGELDTAVGFQDGLLREIGGLMAEQKRAGDELLDQRREIRQRARAIYDVPVLPETVRLNAKEIIAALGGTPENPPTEHAEATARETDGLCQCAQCGGARPDRTAGPSARRGA